MQVHTHNPFIPFNDCFASTNTPVSCVLHACKRSYPLLELNKFSARDCVCFGNDRDDVDLLVQLFHTHKVKGLDPGVGRGRGRGRREGDDGGGRGRRETRRR